MTHEVYLKHTQSLIIGIRGPKYWGELHEFNFAGIMYWPEKGAANANEDNNKGTRIGDLVWTIYKQELAIANGINMTNVTDINIRSDFPILLELDYTQISQKTIDEIGPVANQNIIILNTFFISAAWRNKGIGVEVMKEFIRQMKTTCGYIIITRNEPAQFSEFNAPGSKYAKPAVELERLEKDEEMAQYKLNAFWQRCGFKQFKDHENVFICIVDKAMPNHGQMAHAANQLT